MKEKKCTKCGDVKSVDKFCPSNQNKDGINSWCKSCANEHHKSYSKTKKGLIPKIYSGQLSNSRRRGHVNPSYTLNQLREWAFSQPIFHKLFNKWVESDYQKTTIPSFDRLDDYKPYSLDNIQITTWAENDKKGRADMKNGINNKQSKSVVGTNKGTGEKIEFPSQNIAARTLCIHNQHISMCCNGKRK